MPPAAALQTAALPPLAQPVIVGVIVLYFAAVAAIGAWATRRTRTARDFYVAGEGVGIWTLAIAAMAATLSGFAFIGGAGLLYPPRLGGMYIVLPPPGTRTPAA